MTKSVKTPNSKTTKKTVSPLTKQKAKATPISKKPVFPFFINYSYFLNEPDSSGSTYGISCICIDSVNERLTWNDIIIITDLILKSNPKFKNVVINNFSPLANV